MARIANGPATTEKRRRKEEREEEEREEGPGPFWRSSHTSSFGVTQSRHIKRRNSCGMSQSTWRGE
jgi:hypothetical protein